MSLASQPYCRMSPSTSCRSRRWQVRTMPKSGSRDHSFDSVSALRSTSLSGFGLAFVLISRWQYGATGEARKLAAILVADVVGHSRLAGSWLYLTRDPSGLP